MNKLDHKLCKLSHNDDNKIELLLYYDIEIV